MKHSGVCWTKRLNSKVSKFPLLMESNRWSWEGEDKGKMFKTSRTGREDEAERFQDNEDCWDPEEPTHKLVLKGTQGFGKWLKKTPHRVNTVFSSRVTFALSLSWLHCGWTKAQASVSCVASVLLQSQLRMVDMAVDDWEHRLLLTCGHIVTRKPGARNLTSTQCCQLGYFVAKS